MLFFRCDQDSRRAEYWSIYNSRILETKPIEDG